MLSRVSVERVCKHNLGIIIVTFYSHEMGLPDR